MKEVKKNPTPSNYWQTSAWSLNVTLAILLIQFKPNAHTYIYTCIRTHTNTHTHTHIYIYTRRHTNKYLSCMVLSPHQSQCDVLIVSQRGLQVYNLGGNLFFNLQQMAPLIIQQEIQRHLRTCLGVCRDVVMLPLVLYRLF